MFTDYEFGPLVLLAPQGNAMSSLAPFDRGLISPLTILRDLRSLAGQAVVGEELTPIQRRMYQPGLLETRLIDVVKGPDAPDLVIIAGSAGGGKSAIIRHVLEAARNSFGETIADATHSEAPNEGQIDRLAAFFKPFCDGRERPGGPTRLIAMNTGMVLQFFKGVTEIKNSDSYRGLEQYIKSRLRVPLSSDASYPSWMDRSVLVLNLDQRPTAGEAGEIFDLILERLDPDREDGVLDGSERCRTCKITDWCFPRANAQTVSNLKTRTILNKAAGDAALRRGRNLPPRALWDLAARLVLGGLDVGQEDPCDQIAEIARAADFTSLVRGLATGTAMDEETGLAPELAAVETTFVPSGEIHDLIAAASLDADADARLLQDCLAGAPGTRPAIENAVTAVREGRVSIEGRKLARIAWLGGKNDYGTPIPKQFLDALIAQRDADSDAAPARQLMEAIEYIAKGLAAGFGVVSGPETFYPTDDGGGMTRKTDVFVKADLLHDGMLWISEGGDPVVSANPDGAEIVGYRPITLSMRLATTGRGQSKESDYFEVGLPLWDLLGRALGGAVPSSVDKERFLGLRRAMESVGQLAAENKNLPLLIRRRNDGEKFRVVAAGPAGILHCDQVF